MNPKSSSAGLGMIPYAIMGMFCFVYAAAAICVSSDDDLAHLILSIRKSTKQVVEFDEKKYSEAFSEPIAITGELEYEPGKHFIKRVTKPFRRSYEITNETLVLRKNGKIARQISINEYPAMRGMFEALRSTFAGDIHTLRNYYHIKLNRGNATWTITFSPKQSSIVRFIDAIIISGSGTQVKRITTREAGGDYSEMTLKALK